MSKFLAIIKREYLPRVRTKGFIISTVLGPLIMIGMAVLPAMIFMINAGDATRLAVVDQTGEIYEHVRESVLREAAAGNLKTTGLDRAPDERMRRAGAMTRPNFEIEQAPHAGRAIEDVKRELSGRVREGEIDAYVILPPDILATGAAEYYGGNVGDMITLGQVRERLSRAVIERRMAEANIDQNLVRRMSTPVNMRTTKISERGEEKDSGGGFFLVLGIGVFILMMVTMYGQLILVAVVEEKETRIAEVLFSSVRAFPLMMGKLVGISLVALTQLAIWALALAVFTLYGAAALAAQGVDATSLPGVSAIVVLYCFLYTLLGYFIYSTIYVLIGAMVTTTQEAGQIAMPVIFLLVAGYLLMFPVIRAPDSPLAFWASIFPFFSPIIMPVRIVTQTPPFWQIALSLLVGIGTIVLLVWLAARIYRIGMLMYGKRPSIPEVARWIRQA